MTGAQHSYHGDEIAIIGLSGRFPSAPTIAQFWENLRNGVEGIATLTNEELLESGIDPSLLQNQNYIKAHGVLDNIDRFDAAFFGFSPRDAEIMDPQHRLFLECAWESLEDAGYAPPILNQRVGVYAGVSMSTYSFNLYSNSEFTQVVDNFQIMVGNDKDYLSTRVSYKLNLVGPSLTVQTGCSSGLTAVHLACQSLLNGECDMVLAGGVSIGVPQKVGYLYQPGGIMSPDGHCRAFDAKAKGTVGGSGVGIVVLKRLEDALADSDSIYAVIKGSAINNDGAAKIGYTAPSPTGQAQVIASALTMARVAPETISYIEGHGSGTTLGDPIEVTALTNVFRAKTKQTQFCALGSVKSNIGHLDAAAGIAGLIKTTLAIKHRAIPPSLHFEQPNPEIDFANSPFYVNATLKEWPEGSTPRRAGVSSFGIGGTNAHVVLEEAPPPESASPTRDWQLLVLSAKTESALEQAIDALADHLRQHPEQSLADVAYTLQVGRRSFAHRCIVVCHSHDDAIQALESRDPKRLLKNVQEAQHQSVVFLLPGQGTQYVNMGSDLYHKEPLFRAHIDRLSEFLLPHLGQDLRNVLYPNLNEARLNVPAPSATSDHKIDLRMMLGRGNSAKSSAEHLLDQTLGSQAAIFVVSYALAQLWIQWGAKPTALLGYSLGEYLAACLSGVLSPEDALKLIIQRARLLDTLPEGAMLAVPLTEQEVQPLLHRESQRDGTHDLSLAAINGPMQCVLSGTPKQIAAVEAELAAQGQATRRLHSPHAFHSTLMQPIAEAFTQHVKQIQLKPPTIPYISNVTGTWITPEEAIDPGYWARHLCQPVRFADGIQEVLQLPEATLLEVGPGSTLGSLAIQNSADGQRDRAVVASLRHEYDQRPDQKVLLENLGLLWLAGLVPNWAEIYRHEQRHRISVPTYRFQRERFWVDRRPLSLMNNAAQSPVSQRLPITSWFNLPSWKPSRLPMLNNQPDRMETRSWLVFVDSSAIGRQLLDRLAQSGQTVVVVMAGDRFEQLPDGNYTLNPHDREGYTALVAELQRNERLPERMLHLWNVTPDDSQSGPDYFEEMQFLGFYSLIFLAQALTIHEVAHPIQGWVLSNGLHGIESRETLIPEKATLLGPCRTIPQEYSNLTLYSIDIAVPPHSSWQERKLIDALWAELWTEGSSRTIAYRGDTRWTQAFERLGPDETTAQPIRLRPKGVYLMTGGLGTQSLIRATYLAQHFQARLALIGRSGLPDRESWPDWLGTHPDDDRVSQQIKQVQALETLGAEVLVIAADVANEAQMRGAFDLVDQRFGELHGVIHAAGISDPSAIQPIAAIGLQEANQHFQAKVHGLYVLDKLLQGRELDFCLLTSSIASFVGGLGLCAYVGASLFMDAFARAHNQGSPVAWTSVNWEGVSAEETVEGFLRLLSLGPIAQVVLSTEDLGERINRRIKLSSGHSGAESAHILNARPALRTAYAPATNEVERRMVEIYQSVLGIDQVGIHDSFFDLGGDSLLGMQMISRIPDAFDISLDMRFLFEKPTAAELAVEIIDRQASLADGSQLADMLLELEDLSEEEVAALLEAEDWEGSNFNDRL